MSTVKPGLVLNGPRVEVNFWRNRISQNFFRPRGNLSLL